MILSDRDKLERSIEIGIQTYYLDRGKRASQHTYLHGHTLLDFIMYEVDKIDEKDHISDTPNYGKPEKLYPEYDSNKGPEKLGPPEKTSKQLSDEISQYLNSWISNKLPDSFKHVVKPATPTETIDNLVVIAKQNADQISKILDDTKSKKEMVNHPSHYNKHKWEVIEILQEFFSDDPLIWQVAKYIFRYKHKEKPVEDLKKSLWYLEYKIKELESVQNSGS